MRNEACSLRLLPAFLGQCFPGVIGWIYSRFELRIWVFSGCCEVGTVKKGCSALRDNLDRAATAI